MSLESDNFIHDMKEDLRSLSEETLIIKSEWISKNLLDFFKTEFLLHDDMFLGCFTPVDGDVIWHKELKDFVNQLAFPAIDDAGVIGFISSVVCSCSPLIPCASTCAAVVCAI